MAGNTKFAGTITTLRQEIFNSQIFTEVNAKDGCTKTWHSGWLPILEFIYRV